MDVLIAMIPCTNEPTLSVQAIGAYLATDFPTLPVSDWSDEEGIVGFRAASSELFLAVMPAPIVRMCTA